MPSHTPRLRPVALAARLAAAIGLLGAGAATAATTSGMPTFAGGETAAVRGLPFDGAKADLALVNLAAEPARCAIALAGPRGERLAPAVRLTLAAGESRPYLDALAGLRAPALAPEAVATVSCDRAFSVFGVLSSPAGGRFDVVEPARAAAAEAAALATLPAAAECSSGATCFDAPGLVHVPKPPGIWQDAVGRVAFPEPSGTATRLRLSIDVKVGDWYAPEPNGKHLIYWFVLDKNLDMPGLLYFRGPGKDEAFARHGIGLTHVNKIKIIKPFKALPGHTYRIVEDYDMAKRTLTITVTDLADGQLEVKLQGRTNVGSYNLRLGKKFLVDMGFFPGKVATEVPSYGWEYMNVHLEAFVKK